MQLYFGPTDSKILKKYDANLDESIPFGWGIFGWINKALFIPLFGFLSSFLPYGIAIIVMTILIKILCFSLGSANTALDLNPQWLHLDSGPCTLYRMKYSS